MWGLKLLAKVKSKVDIKVPEVTPVGNRRRRERLSQRRHFRADHAAMDMGGGRIGCQAGKDNTNH